MLLNLSRDTQTFPLSFIRIRNIEYSLIIRAVTRGTLEKSYIFRLESNDEIMFTRRIVENLDIGGSLGKLVFTSDTLTFRVLTDDEVDNVLLYLKSN